MSAAGDHTRRIADELGAAALVVFHQPDGPRRADGKVVLEATIAAKAHISKTAMLHALRQVVAGFEAQLVRGEPLD